jgi:hypothetical protein
MIPSDDGGLFVYGALVEPYEHYRRLRDLGLVVRLSTHDVNAVTRYVDLRETLISSFTRVTAGRQRSTRPQSARA